MKKLQPISKVGYQYISGSICRFKFKESFISNKNYTTKVVFMGYKICFFAAKAELKFPSDELLPTREECTPKRTNQDSMVKLGPVLYNL